MEDVSFLETVELLGGWRALGVAVLALFALYVLLVEVLMPRRRARTGRRKAA